MKKLTFASIVLNIVLGIFLLLKYTSTPKINDKNDKAFYTLGVELGKNVERFTPSNKEFDVITLGLKDRALKKQLQVNPNESMHQLQIIEIERVKAAAQGEVNESTQYLKGIENQTGITKRESGLLIKNTLDGSGKSPSKTDTVKVHYEGRLRNGTVFDSSIKRGQPALFRLEGVIPCWTEALQLMKVGGKSTVYCPYTIAYGERGAPPLIPGGAVLTFDIELLSIETPAKPKN